MINYVKESRYNYMAMKCENNYTTNYKFTLLEVLIISKYL